LAATQAEEYDDGPETYGLAEVKFRNSLYSITYGILNREFLVRGFRLNPAQQFVMIATLIENKGIGPYSLEEIREAAEYGLEEDLADLEAKRLPSHAIFIPAMSEKFTFRFEYLMNFAPAVWLCDYLIKQRQNASIEKY
jgi:hypothetical protein